MNTGLSNMKYLFASIVLALMAAVCWALPSVEAVQAEVQRGNYVQAESMMREVVDAKPGSAKAHYIYSEILAHNGHIDQAVQELRQARQLDPELKFTTPEKSQSFERLLQQHQEQQQARRSSSGFTSPAFGNAPVQAPIHASDRGFSLPGWVWGLGGVLVILFIWRLFTATRQSSVTSTMMSPAGGYGASPGYGPVVQPGAGSGMLGTGLAAAGGFAAGMLAEKMLEGRHDGSSASSVDTGGGGLQPGVFDSPADDELEHRSIDFGSGGDWDSGGSGDVSGSDSGDGGW